MINAPVATFTVNLAALLLFSAAPCLPSQGLSGQALPNLQAPQNLRFQLIGNNLIMVPVMAGDQGPFYFLLDTGADTSIVDISLARKLSLLTLRSIKQTTITGSRLLNVSLIASLSLDAATVKALPILEEDLSALRHLDSRIRGIVGQDFLSHFNYLLDYRDRTLQIEEGDRIREAIDGDPVPVQVGDNRLIIAAETASVGPAPLHLLLDSGADTLVLMGKASAAVRCSFAQQRSETSANGEALLRTAQVDRLSVASREFRNIPVTLVPTAPPEDIGDGLLPTALFHAVYVNSRQRFVILNPGARRLSQFAIETGGQ